MKIAVFVEFGKNYSGGRYHSFMLAQGLVNRNEVDIYCDQKPIFYKDFLQNKNLEKINLIPIKNFKNLKINYDWIIITPSRNTSIYYRRIISEAKKIKSKIAFINFETPNWYNETFQKNLRRDNLISFLADNSHLCLSSTKISMDYAKRYFSKYKELIHEYAYPSINSYALKKNQITKKNQIVLISRFGQDAFSKHKTSIEIEDLFIDQFKGIRMVIIYSGNINEKKYINIANKKSISLNFIKSISDIKKFEIISESKFMIFLSSFEGFGYPPVESICAGTPVFAKKLEVLKEVSGSKIIYIDEKNLTKTKFINRIDKINLDYPEYSKRFTINNYGKELNRIFKENLNGYALINPKRSFPRHLLNFFIKDDFKSIALYFKSLILDKK